MTAADMTRLETFFTGYTRRFAGADGLLHPMQQLKVAHSWRVVSNAERIMADERWSELHSRVGRGCALLHDVGRFPQYAEFGSFEDHKTINHAVRGAAVLHAEGVLAALPDMARETIFMSVRHHNVRELSPDLPADQIGFVHLVRDADKLDIFRVFEDAVRSGNLQDHPEIAWSLPERGTVNPEILADVFAGRAVEYHLVRSLCDFVMIQVGWLQGHLHYDAAVALACKRQALEFREEYVCASDNSSAVRDCFALTRKAMQARVGRRSQPTPVQA